MIPTWGWWTAGGLAVAGLGYKYLTRDAGTPAADAESDGVTVANPQPLFMASGGGGGLPSGVGLDNLKQVYQPEKVPLADNPDVAIAKINADVQMAAINAAALLQKAGIDAGTTPDNTQPVTGARTGIRGNVVQQGAQFIVETQKSGTATSQEMKIYNAAKKAGYNADEVAASFSAAGQNVSTSDVNKWLAQQGLSL